MGVYIEQFFVREGWIITIVVLLYAVLISMRAPDKAFLRLIVPIIISFILHTIRLVLHAEVDILKYISDILYDYFTPVGIYRFVVIVRDYRIKKKGGGDNG